MDYLNKQVIIFKYIMLISGKKRNNNDRNKYLIIDCFNNNAIRNTDI